MHVVRFAPTRPGPLRCSIGNTARIGASAGGATSKKREAGDDIGRPEILPVFLQVAERIEVLGA
jgi:hypothetical protein